MFSTSLEPLMCPDTFTVRSGRNLYRELISFFVVCVQIIPELYFLPFCCWCKTQFTYLHILQTKLLTGFFVGFLPSASVWQAIQHPVCVVWPETKLSSSGSATPSCNRSVSLSLSNWIQCLCCQSSARSLHVVLIQTYCFVAYTSAPALHPSCNRSCCWRGSKQVSGNTS